MKYSTFNNTNIITVKTVNKCQSRVPSFEALHHPFSCCHAIKHPLFHRDHSSAPLKQHNGIHLTHQNVQMNVLKIRKRKKTQHRECATCYRQTQMTNQYRACPSVIVHWNSTHYFSPRTHHEYSLMCICIWCLGGCLDPVLKVWQCITQGASVRLCRSAQHHLPQLLPAFATEGAFVFAGR